MSVADTATNKASGLSSHTVSTGLLAAFVGFASTFALILKALIAVGATPAQAASGLMALSVVMGAACVLLSLKTRMPICVAWSTPGAALLATTVGMKGGFSVAVGAFVINGVLLTIAGLWKPLGRAVMGIPSSIANAMLAGVLLGLCLAPIHAVAQFPAVALPIIVLWAVVSRIKKVLAMPVAAIATLVGIIYIAPSMSFSLTSVLPRLEWVSPHFDLSAAIGIALPLFLVTMASQNIPGVAILKVNGYHPEPGRLFTATGIATLITAPFGGFALNLAAITAALCAGDEAGPDKSRRYWAGVVCGVGYILFGLCASLASVLIAAAPPVLIESVAGLALLGSMGAALLQAVSHAKDREAAIITLLVTASGQAFFGLSGAFWGLLAGGTMLLLSRWRESA